MADAAANAFTVKKLPYDVLMALDVSGMYAVGSSPDEFAAFLERDYQYQDKLMGELGLKVK